MSDQLFNDLDLSAYEQEIKQATENLENSSKNSNFRSYYWWEWKKGDNKMFICPPWAPGKFLFKKVYSFKDLPKHVVSRNHQCIELTYPELGLKCPLKEVLRKWAGKGHDMYEYDVSFNAYANVIDFEGKWEEWDETFNNKTVHKTGDFSVIPYVARLTERVFNTLVSWLGNPMTTKYYDPHAAIPINIITEHNKDGQIQKYTPSVIQTVNEQRQAVPMRMMMHQKAERVLEIIQNLNNLDDIFKAPIEEIKPGGAIYNDAIKLDQYFEQLFANTNTAAPIMTPGITTDQPPVVDPFIAKGFTGKDEHDLMVKRLDITQPDTITKYQQWMQTDGTKSGLEKLITPVQNVVNPPVVNQPVVNNPVVNQPVVNETPVVNQSTNPPVESKIDVPVNKNGLAIKPKPIASVPDCFGYNGNPEPQLKCDTCPFNVICKQSTK